MRRFLIWVGVLVGAFIIVVLGMGLFLMLAPGSQLFGIKYIKATAGNTANVTREYTGTLEGDLVIETTGVPITIEYHPYTNFQFTFVQKFNGFTRSKIDVPDVKVTKDEAGNLVVHTSEFTKFLWGNNSKGYSLTCKVPATYRNHSLTVSSNGSSVYVSAHNDAVADINKLVVATKGGLSFGGKINISEFIINNTKYHLTIPASVNVKSANLMCKDKGVTIESAVSGDINFSSKKGSLQFVSCNNLSASCSSGSVISTSSGTSVAGNATIKTGGKGKVVLQHVGGNLEIGAAKGAVEIGLNDKGTQAGVGQKVNIGTSSGWVSINGSYNPELLVNIKTSSGKVFVKSAISKLEVETKSGSVEVKEAAELKIAATKGNIKVEKFTISADISTTSGDVTVAGNSLFGRLKITTGKNGHVNATNLGGQTTISAGGSINAQFTNILGKIDISGTSKEIKVIVPDAISASTNIIWVESKKTSAYIKLIGLENSGKKYKSQENIPTDEESRLIKITSTSGKIRLCAESFK